MQHPFGSVFNLTVSPARSWLSVGPGWAVLAGALSTGPIELKLNSLTQLFVLWLLVDSILGALWQLSVEQGLWQRMAATQLPPPARQGFYLPYAQPGSTAGQLALQIRRYSLWWREIFWPEQGRHLAAFGLGAGLALLISLSLSATFFWLTMLALGLIIVAGHTATDLTTTEGGRLQSIVQLLLPWVMGATLWSSLNPLSLLLGICYWVTYLGGLRMLGGHQRAEILFFLSQIAAVLLLLALRLLPGAALVATLLIVQYLIKTKFNQPELFLSRTQPYLLLSLLIAGWSLGQTAG